MLKMFQGQHSSSSTSEFWDASWDANELAQVLADVRVVENDPVYELIVEKLRPDRLFLEGGCGQSQWVKYFNDRHYRTVGIDFAARTIERVLSVGHGIPVGERAGHDPLRARGQRPRRRRGRLFAARARQRGPRDAAPGPAHRLRVRAHGQHAHVRGAPDALTRA